MEGLVASLLNILSDFGDVPEDILGLVQNLDEAGIKKWTKLAVNSANFEELRRILEL